MSASLPLMLAMAMPIRGTRRRQHRLPILLLALTAALHPADPADALVRLHEPEDTDLAGALLVKVSTLPLRRSPGALADYTAGKMAWRGILSPVLFARMIGLINGWDPSGVTVCDVGFANQGGAYAEFTAIGRCRYSGKGAVRLAWQAWDCDLRKSRMPMILPGLAVEWLPGESLGLGNGQAEADRTYKPLPAHDAFAEPLGTSYQFGDLTLSATALAEGEAALDATGTAIVAGRDGLGGTWVKRMADGHVLAYSPILDGATSDVTRASLASGIASDRFIVLSCRPTHAGWRIRAEDESGKPLWRLVLFNVHKEDAADSAEPDRLRVEYDNLVIKYDGMKPDPGRSDVADLMVKYEALTRGGEPGPGSQQIAAAMHLATLATMLGRKDEAADRIVATLRSQLDDE